MTGNDEVQCEVVVVGGGPAGASTAWHLAQRGVTVTVLDRARFPRDKVCAEYLSPQASRILAAMGALPVIEQHASQLRGMAIRAPNGGVIYGQFAARHGFHAFRDRGLGVRRTLLDSTLVERVRAEGITVREGVRVTDLLRDATGRVTGVRALDDAGHTTHYHAKVVVGADGLRSVVARRLGLVHSARWPKRLALVAHFRNVGGVSDVGELHVERDGYVGIADVGGDAEQNAHSVINVALVVPAHAARDVAADKDAYLTQWLARHPHLGSRFAAATPLEPVRVTGPFAASTRPAWAPGAVLVGDAADFFDPFTGEGVYSALRGGELLAPFVEEAVRAESPEGADIALDGYERARRAEFSGKWTVERIIGGVIAVPALMNHAARALSRRRDMADLLVGVAGDFVPAREVLRFGYIARLLLFGV